MAEIKQLVRSGLFRPIASGQFILVKLLNRESICDWYSEGDVHDRERRKYYVKKRM